MISEQSVTKKLDQYTNIVSLLNESVITMADLEEFSDELKETIRFITR